MASIEEMTINSSYIENMIEHVFIAEIMQESWINRNGKKVEVLRSEVDDCGYDIVLSCDGVTRYIQLKTSEVNGKTSVQKLNLLLTEKENACIIWIIRNEIKKEKRFAFSYKYFGSKAGEKFPDISEFKIAKHTKANSEGVKKERPNIREVPKNKFRDIKTTEELFDCLFIE